jgi:nucleoid DNA-binding protein
MNISALILEFLKEREKVTVSGFGDFVLENAAAVLNPEDRTLLPPGQKINYNPNYEAVGPEFAHFVSARKNISIEDASQEITTQINFWKNKINEGENFSVEHLGEFKISADSVLFRGNRFSGDRSDFYGLEEINMNELRKRKGNAAGGDPYRFNRPLLWVMLLALPVAALAYIGITQPELLFGRKSFTESSLKDAPKQNKQEALKTDTLNQSRLDSLKKDSLSAVAVVPVNKPTAKKAWTSKKHPAKKWRKAKKRVNRSQ